MPDGVARFASVMKSSPVRRFIMADGTKQKSTSANPKRADNAPVKKSVLEKFNRSKGDNPQTKRVITSLADENGVCEFITFPPFQGIFAPL